MSNPSLSIITPPDFSGPIPQVGDQIYYCPDSQYQQVATITELLPLETDDSINPHQIDTGRHYTAVLKGQKIWEWLVKVEPPICWTKEKYPAVEYPTIVWDATKKLWKTLFFMSLKS